MVAPLPLQLWATWVPHEYAFTPYGFRLGVLAGTEVGTYPLGLPVLMAAAIRVGGELAAYLVPPLCAGLLVWCVFVLATWLAGEWAGLLAAVLVALSPATLALAAQPMSDVPAAAFWALAWVMSLRPGLGASAASGSAVAAAMMVRPNLGPLVFILVPLVARSWGDRHTSADTPWRRVLLFMGVAAIGPFVVAWSQNELYGSPFRTGYLTPQTYFQVANIWLNAEFYPRLLMTVHTPLLLLAWPAAVVLWRSPANQAVDIRARAVMLSASGFIALTYLLYLPYTQYDTLFSLRFMLPAIVALFILFAGVLTRAAAAVKSRSRVLACLTLAPAVVVAVYPAAGIRYALNVHNEQTGLIVAGHYLKAALPANAAIFTSVHGGGLAHYTGRMIVRIDALSPESFDAVIDDVRRHGYWPVLVLDRTVEESAFQARFAQSPFSRLDWPPRAEFGDVFRFRYWDFADRAGYRQRQRWAIDVITAPR